MTIFVDKTATVVTGTTGADSIIFGTSAAIPGTTILGYGGDDTINVTLATVDASATGPIYKGGDGNDIFHIASGSFSAGQTQLFGGVGNDTINLNGGGFALVKGNEGADLLSGAATISAAAIKMGGGADKVTLADVQTKDISLGGGHDHLSATVTLQTAASITGGGGKDTINIAISGLSAAVILGDKGVDAPNADVIDVAGTNLNGVRIKGQNGADSITYSGSNASAFIAGGLGNDSIIVSAQSVSGNGSIYRGGAGNDTIFLAEGGAEGAVVTFDGGSGADSIAIDNTISGYDSLTVRGGEGADSITLSNGSDVISGQVAAGASTVVGNLSYSALTESNLSAMDVVTVGANTLKSGVAVNFDFGNQAKLAIVTQASAQVLFGDSTNYASMVTTGVAALAGSLNVSSITAIAGSLDTLTLSSGAGTVATVIASGGDQYLFMQGGTAGTADDSVTKLAGLGFNEVAATNAEVTLDGSAAVVQFSGTLV